MTEEINIWSIDDENTATSLGLKKQIETEELLEEILVKNPNLLFSGLRLVGRQTPTAGGPLDLLGVDEDGRLVVFELKRGILAREAVAQVIDYASFLNDLDPDALARLISENSGKHGIEEIEDFLEWHSGEFETLDALRPLRMCLVGLGADESTERMTAFLAENSSMDISLITFHGFEWDGQTLLARRVQVEGASSLDQRPAKRYPSTAERRQMLEKRLMEYGVSDLFGAVRERFRGNWPRCTEYIGTWAIGFYLLGQTNKGYKSRSYARVQVEDRGEMTISVVLYGRTMRLCPEVFEETKKAMKHEYRSSSGDPLYDELKLPIDAEGWATHQERLTTLIQRVYKAWEGRE